MIAKNELMETLAAVQTVATEQGADVGTIVNCCLIGVLDEVNGALQAIGAQFDAWNELQQTQFRQVLSLLKQMSGHEGIALDFDEIETAGPRLLRDQVSDLHDDLVGVLRKMAQIDHRIDAAEKTAAEHDERIGRHAEGLQILRDTKQDKLTLPLPGASPALPRESPA